MREQDWTWYQLDTNIVREYGKEMKKLDKTMRLSVFPSLVELGVLQEHIYDCNSAVENMHILNLITTAIPILHRELLHLGWKVKKIKKEDEQERTEFYDTLLKGGNIDPKKGMH